jgi:hypothetical protein
MVVANTLYFTDDIERHLRADFEIEEPLVLQLGGSDPERMGVATKIALNYGYKVSGNITSTSVMFTYITVDYLRMPQHLNIASRQ